MKNFTHGGNTYPYPSLRHDFSVNLNPLGAPQDVISAIKRSADKFAAYPDPDCRALCAAIAAKHGTAPENVLCGSGAADIIIRLALALRPSCILSLAPSFSEYEKAAQLSRASFRTFPLRAENGFLLDSSVLSAITPETGLVFLCNPNNPTGSLAPHEILCALLEKCEQSGAILALDECFLEFTNAPSMTARLSSPNLVVINAFTKTYAMAGLRLGYMLCSNRELLRKTADFSQSWCVSSPAQTAGLSALGCRAWLAEAKALINEQRPYLAAGLERLGIEVFPSNANFLLCKSPLPLFQKLLSRGILVRDCSSFPTLDERYFRVCVSSRELNDILLTEISEVLNG